MAKLLAIVFALAQVGADPRDIRNGWEIPSEGYCDQPYVVVLDDGMWLCTLTTGPGEEGNDRQHVVATRSTDRGRTWGPLIDIEPQGPPEASWVMPLTVPGGRVYAFYVYNAENRREVIASTDYARRRVDTLGQYMFRYSDDGGLTWSQERYRVPIRTFEIDRENPYGGEVQFFWGVGKPILHDGAAYIGVAKVGSFGQGFIERSEGFFLRSDNILTEPDPARISWETLPAGDVGLRAPQGPIAEEHNLVPLSDGSLYCTYRTVDGHPCHAYSRDEGRSWTPPAYMTYEPGGRLLKHPRAANFVRRFSNGKYLYWFHNHGGKSFEGRNPVWLSGGVEKDGHIVWSQPEIVLYDQDPKVRMSYPDFIEQGGRIFVTETQKTVARVHEIAPRIVEALWNQHENRDAAREGLVLETAERVADMPRLPTLAPGQGFTLDLWIEAGKGEVLDARDDTGRGIALSVTPEGALRLSSGERTWDSDPGLLVGNEPHHATVIVDGGPRILMFVVDGRLCDGGDVRPQGWYRIEPGLADFNGGDTVRLGQGTKRLRVYGHPLLVSEAVGNSRAEG